MGNNRNIYILCVCVYIMVEQEKQQESIKLTKNSRGYSWEVKLVVGVEESDGDALRRLYKLESALNARYKGEDKKDEK